MSILQFNSTKVKPDIVHEYSPDIRYNHTPLVIDNGSFSCRVGWSNDVSPRLVFRNLLAKPRKDRTKKEGDVPVTPITQIGNDIVNIEALRFQLRTQFDKNVVTHFQIQEQILDYIFSHLSIDGDHAVDHPIVMTECFVNPNYTRQLMSELLFECYSVPSVAYGVDSLFSFYKNMPNIDNGLIVSCGYHTTLVVPVLNKQTISDKARRINLGGFHMINFLHRMLQLKYPVHINAITQSRVEELLHDHCSIACDYKDQLLNWANLDYYENHVKKMQLPFNQTVSNVPVLTAEQKIEKKRDLARRLIEVNARRREEKLAEDEDQLNTLLNIRELYDEDEEENEEFDNALRENQIKNLEELEKLIATISSKIEKTKQKMANQEAVSNTTSTSSTPIEEKIPQPPPDMPVDIWVDDVKKKRFALIERRNARKQRRQDLAKRHTVAAQERMRIISQLARKEKGTDDFGMRDEDWDIYKAISKDGDSDSDVENEKLIEYEMVLRHHDPTFEEPQITQSGIAEYHQLHVGVEIHRTPELLFQPSMIGSCEAGLIETIDYVLKLFSPEEQLLLANNVFLTGGCCKFPGLKERLSREMTEIRPFETTHSISMATDPSLDAWYGAKSFANEPNLKSMSILKEMYNEFGGDCLTSHYASNVIYTVPPQ